MGVVASLFFFLTAGESLRQGRGACRMCHLKSVEAMARERSNVEIRCNS